MNRSCSHLAQDHLRCPRLSRAGSTSVSILCLSLAFTFAFASALHADGDDPELDRVFAHLEFLQGPWTGSGFGGKADEVWLPPRDGQMLGLFRLVGGTMPRFSEILTIGRFDGQIELRLKHFDERLHGWEKQDDVVTFPFDSSEPGKVVFRGLTFLDAGPGRLEIQLKMRNADRSWTEVFEFERPTPR